MRVKRKNNRKTKANANYRLFDNHIIDERGYNQQKELFEHIYARYSQRVKDNDFSIAIEKINLNKKINNYNKISRMLNFLLLFNSINILINVFWGYLPKIVFLIISVLVFLKSIELFINKENLSKDDQWVKTSLEVLDILESEKRKYNKSEIYSELYK